MLFSKIKCIKCKHGWTSRKEQPRACPRCRHNINSTPKIRKHQRLSEIGRKRWQNPEYREKQTQNMKDFGQEMKNAWKNYSFKNKIVKAIIRGNHTKPNKPETFINNILQTNFPNEWKLNVHGDTILNGKVPDWINCNGQKKCINHNGIYWHLFRQKNPSLTKQMVEESESKPYEELGFKLLIIWEDELGNREKVVEKIKSFTEKGDGGDVPLKPMSLVSQGCLPNLRQIT